MLCRFYNWNLDDIKKLTIKEFNSALEYIGKISRIENGKGEEAVRVGGEAELSSTLKNKKFIS